MIIEAWTVISGMHLFHPIIDDDSCREGYGEQWLAFVKTRVLTIGLCLSLSFAICLLLACILRRRTKIFLERSGLPTVYWTPRFMRYRPFKDEKKLSASNITGILPKMRKHGGPYGMFGTVYGITTPVIHVAHPVPAKAILTGRMTKNAKGTPRRPSSGIAHSTATSKAPSYDHFKDYMGNGVFTTDGEDWKQKRAAIVHCLIKGTASSTSEISQKLEIEANRAAATFCHQMKCLQRQTPRLHKASDVLTVNVVPLLQQSTIGFIYRYITHAEPKWLVPTNMVYEVDSDNDSDENYGDSDDGDGNESVLITHENSSLASSTDETVTKDCMIGDDDCGSSFSSASSLLDTYLSCTLRIRMIVLANSRSIWYLLPRWCYRLFSSLYRDEKSTLGPIHAFAKRACEDAQPLSPLGRLRDSEGPYKPTMCSSHRGRMTLGSQYFNDNLLHEATTLLFAGQDTGAATLSWTLHLLSLYPNVQEKLAKEVHTAFTDNESSASCNGYLITRKLVSKLTYLDAVVKESMRLYPVAPFIVRRLQEDICFSTEENDDTMSLPAGSNALIWIYSLHRNPKFWSRPDDFLPERWVDIDMKDLGQSNGAYMPFATGPRNCLGQPIAHVVIRTILAKIIYEYKFTDPRLHATDKPEDLRKEMEAGFTVLPTGGVHLDIQSRKLGRKNTF